MYKTIFLFLASILIFSCSLFEQKTKRIFEKESWVNNKEYRHEMSDDLLENYLYVGMVESEVVILLGTPDYISSENEYYMGSGLDYSYMLYIKYVNGSIFDYYEKKEFW